MIDWKEIPDGDTWELFARDFLVELGFVIEVGPGRGADAGKDLLISEQLRGTLHSSNFKWLVSCKHFATSGKSVGTEDETNITDRLKHHKADGFMGFYSTMPSSALVTRLQQYAVNGDLQAYEIFDHKKIEGRFVNAGLSKLALRYFPAGYRHMRPIQRLFGRVVELRCDVCGADILTRSVTDSANAALVWMTSLAGSPKYQELYVCCKGACDAEMERGAARRGLTTQWEDVEDLCNPILFLKNTLTYMNMLRADPTQYSDAVHRRMKQIYMSLAQRTLREITDEDFERFKDLSVLDGVL
jgi:hypothetical protein